MPTHFRHKNQVRIIGGSHRSRLVYFHNADGLRPSADSVREKLFNWLGQGLEGKKVLDLFSGSGVMGFEAASRGAEKVVLVEKHSRVYTDIVANLNILKLPLVQLYRDDALDYLRRCQELFNVVFLDPPYAWQDWQKLWPLLLPRLHANAEIYIETAMDIVLPDSFIIRKNGQSGISRFVLADYMEVSNDKEGCEYPVF